MNSPTSRREFLSRPGSSGALLAVASWLPSIGYAQTNGPARAVINQARYCSLTEPGTREGGLRRLG